MKKLQKVRNIENYSGVSLSATLGKIPPLRSGYYRVLPIPVSGDAPKNFIQAYLYGSGKKIFPTSWPKYIAKVGHKWYPLESITEHLLNQIGATIGLRTADSELRMAHGQLRFLSRYFLKKDESLVHGAEIYSAYLGEKDEKFVDQIERNNLSREWLTFQFTIDAIRHVFPSHGEEIVLDLLKMLVLDAFVGNNDRHFYNWGVIVDIKNQRPPVLAPIYDTARGLFWNFSEEKINLMFSSKDILDKRQIISYAKKSMPKIGWHQKKKVNHFQLIEHIFLTYPDLRPICKSIICDVNYRKSISLLKEDFKHFFSDHRLQVIIACLNHRFEKLQAMCA